MACFQLEVFLICFKKRFCISDWSMISLGKRYFEFSFESPNDLRRVWLLGYRNLNPSVLRPFDWMPDFDPFSAKHSNAQCWVRLHSLSREYWRPKILFEISGSLGVPVALDEAVLVASDVVALIARVVIIHKS